VNTVIRHDWPLALDVDAALRGQGGDAARIRQRKPRLVAVAERALTEGETLLTPAVAVRRLQVIGLQHERLLLTEDGVLSGPLVAELLAGAEELALIIATIGGALERRVSEIFPDSPLYALALDGVGTAAVEALATAACREIEGIAAAAGLQTTTPISPGLVGWPAEEGQTQIFALVDGAGIGVVLSDAGMMIPRKSTSLVVGLGTNLTKSGLPCDYCALQETCRHRERQPVAVPWHAATVTSNRAKQNDANLPDRL